MTNKYTGKNAVLKLSFSRSGWVEPNQANPARPLVKTYLILLYFAENLQQSKQFF